jgi:hypothetical protein
MSKTIPALDADAAQEWMQALWGKTSGWANLQIGTTQESFRWPGDKDKLLARVLQAAPEFDVWAAVLLRTSNGRSNGNGRPGKHAWCDADADKATPEREEILSRVRHFAVASGTPGNLQVYVPLSTLQQPEGLRELNGRLRLAIGGDSTDDPARVLRIPGTLNHKPCKDGTHRCRAVTWHRPPGTEAGYGRQEFAELFPRTAPPRPDGPAAGEDGLPDYEPLPEPMPWGLRRAIESDPDNHSDYTYYLACAGVRAKLTNGQQRTLLEGDPTTTDRRAESKRQQDGWWAGEFWRVVKRARKEVEIPCPVLPDSFWQTESHPFLGRVRQAALSVMRSPDSILHYVLGDVSALTHYRHVLPDYGSPGTLDLLVNAVARSGGGKGVSANCASRLTRFGEYEEQGEDDRRVRTRALGSGEGMAASYFEMLETEDGDHKTETRYAIAVRFVSAEGAEYAKLSDRSGQTTAMLIRSIFMGERIGGTYVGQSRNKQLAERQYRAVLMLQLQPVAVRAILDEREVGTPQRMLWSCPRYEDLPPLDDLPEWPGPLDWKPSEKDLRLDPTRHWNPQEIPVDDEVRREVKVFLYKRATGEESGEYDGHRALLRLKVAALLGCLRTGKPVVSLDDWSVAGQVMDTSDKVRDWAEAWLGSAEAQKREAGIKLFADRQVAAERAVRSEQDHVATVAGRIRRYLVRHPGGTPRPTLRDSCCGPKKRDKPWFEAGLARAQAENWAEQRDGSRWHATARAESMEAE